MSAKVYTLRRRIYVVVPATHIGLYNRCWCKRGTVRNDRSAKERKGEERGGEENGGSGGSGGSGHEASAEYSLVEVRKGGGNVGRRGLALLEEGNDPGYAGSTVVRRYHPSSHFPLAAINGHTLPL